MKFWREVFGLVVVGFGPGCWSVLAMFSFFFERWIAANSSSVVIVVFGLFIGESVRSRPRLVGLVGVEDFSGVGRVGSVEYIGWLRGNAEIWDA